MSTKLLITLLPLFAATAVTSSSIPEFIERYGFPVAVAVALWLRMERTEQQNRDDRMAAEKERVDRQAASDAERLTALKDLHNVIQDGHRVMHQAVKDGTRAHNDNATAMRMMTRKMRQVVPCMRLEEIPDPWGKHKDEADFNQSNTL